MTADPPAPRIVLIHATRIAMEPIRVAMSRHWPAAECINILEEALSIDRAKVADLDAGLTRRIRHLVDYAADIGADGVLFTCTAFGAAIEAAAAAHSVPTLKPNEAMFEAALAHGPNIAMLYTFPPARASMVPEFDDEARLQGLSGRLTPVFVPNAIEAVQAGDTATHDRLIAAAAAALKGFDAVMLAQFSMARAQAAARAVCPMPVLSSPDAAVAKLKARVGSTEPERC